MSSVSPRECTLEEDLLTAPSVGTWRPEVGQGTPLVAGLRLGTLLRDGRPLAVLAPAGAWGVATEVAKAGTWVAFGAALLRCTEGGLGAVAAPAPKEVGGPEGAVAVRAETDGTVYLRPDPAAPAFAALGTAVAAQATVALVEVMKTFTPVRAPLAGEVVQVDVTDGGSVAAGMAIVWVRPG